MLVPLLDFSILWASLLPFPCTGVPVPGTKFAQDHHLYPPAEASYWVEIYFIPDATILFALIPSPQFVSVILVRWAFWNPVWASPYQRTCKVVRKFQTSAAVTARHCWAFSTSEGQRSWVIAVGRSWVMLDFLLWFGMLLMVPGTSLILDPFPPVSVATGPPGNALMTFHFLNCVSSCRERKASYKWSSPTWMALLCIWLLCGFSQGREYLELSVTGIDNKGMGNTCRGTGWLPKIISWNQSHACLVAQRLELQSLSDCAHCWELYILW